MKPDSDFNKAILDRPINNCINVIYTLALICTWTCDQFY